MIDSNTYSEVYEILSYMDKSIVMKIPIEILENIKEKRNKNYTSNIDPNDLFNSKNVKKQTIEILACLDVNFWMNDEKKNKLKENYNKKVLDYQNELRMTYNSDNIFNDTATIKIDNSKIDNVSTSIIEYKEKNFLQKLFDKIKHLFKKN